MIKMIASVVKAKKILLYSMLFFCILFLVKCTPSPKEPRLLTVSGTTMGTVYNIKITDHQVSGRSVDMVAIKIGIETVLREINEKMSTFLKNSEISRFNRFQLSDWFPVSAETAWVIKKSFEVSEKSEGAFDITVGSLVNLWGFGPWETREIPEGRDIQEKLMLTGYKNIGVRLSPPALKKKRQEMICDLSAIAKGYGVDRIAQYLEAENIADYLVEIGGEVRARGKNNYNKWWRIGIASPTNTFGIQKVIDLKNRSMATSGDYRNYFEKDGIRYSHTINPKTGRPISHNLASVTVIDDSCLVADALATAINVLGPDKGYDFALKEDLAVFFVRKADNGFIEKSTPKFEKILDSRGDQN